MRKWLWLVTIVLVGVTAALAWGGARALAARRFRSELELAQREIAARQYGRAHKRLIKLGRRQDDGGEVDYQLGICELYRGHADLANAAWERVDSKGKFGTRAAFQTGMLALNTGQLTRAERILVKARTQCEGADALPVLQGLQLLFHIEGRLADVRQMLIASWSATDTPAEVLKQLFRLDAAPLPVDVTRGILDKGPRDDDRVWLGRANLAIRTGQLDEVAQWLAACVRRRPNDPPVWMSRLEFARATANVAAAWEALEHLQAATLSAAERLRIRAWMAAQGGDTKAEWTALNALAALEPGDTASLDRLAALAGASGKKDEVSRLRAQKAEMMAALQQYRERLRGAQIGNPAELANLAQALGRHIEARGWSLINDRQADRPGSARPPLIPADAPAPETTLAAVFADLRHLVSKTAASADSIAPPRFVDAAMSAGLNFMHQNGQTPLKRLPETMSGGIGILDYDGDGWLDIYAVQGGAFPPGKEPKSSDRLFRNRRDGTFEDVSERTGIARTSGGYGHGVTVGDYDNDGRPDLFVTRWRRYALLHNRGDGKFEELTDRAGLGGDRDWPTSAAWADLDGDGDLDLYVCHYLAFDIETAQPCTDERTRGHHYCSPSNFASLPDHVFRNDGGRFVDVTSASGFVDPDGRGLGVVAVDLDDDNRIDVYVANDMSANYLFRNLGGFRFEETAFQAGAAANSSGRFQSGMGIACGDWDRDGRPDLAVTNYYGESTTLFHNLGRGLFADDTVASGVAAPTRQLLGFGIAFLDANNDGRLDLVSANGHVSDYRPASPWQMPVQLLVGGREGRLTDVSARAGEPFRPRHLGRGLAIADLDNDGRTDVIVQAQNEPLVYLHNETERAGNWLTVLLQGVRSNRDGVGARVLLESGGERQVQHRFGGGSYQSASDPRLYFGSARKAPIDRLEVRWPSGQVDGYDGLEWNRGYLLREGAHAPEALPGWDRRPS